VHEDEYGEPTTELKLVAAVEHVAAVVRLDAESPFTKPAYAATVIVGGEPPYGIDPFEAVILRGAFLTFTDPPT
jgi:hypothetical protein